jgi:hypothetical protein
MRALSKIENWPSLFLGVQEVWGPSLKSPTSSHPKLKLWV